MVLYMMSINSNPSFFTRNLLNWYEDNKRDLPWRHTRDPYKIWLSEVILQQTRVEQGQPYYERFIEEFPTIQGLARADEQEILRLWQGLGYYSRARNLHRCAKIICENYDGIFPSTYEEVIKLPGIGPYTAAAICSIAFKLPTPVVDGNVFRFLARYFGIDDDIAQAKTRKKFELISQDLIDPAHPDIYNQAVMEFGARQCTPKSPDCGTCPFRESCVAFANNLQQHLPVKLKKTKVRDRYFHYIVWLQNGKIGLKKRGEQGIWSGLFEFDLYESDKMLALDELTGTEKARGLVMDESAIYKHQLSHQTIYARFWVVKLENENLEKLSFYTAQEVEKLPKPRLIDRYLTTTLYSLVL